MTLRPLTAQGKFAYLWHPEQIGSPAEVVQALKDAHADGVAIKIHNGSYFYWYIRPYVDALRAAGFLIGAWGYIYLRYAPLAEANTAIKAVQELGPFEFYLIDAEAYAKLQWVGAKIFATRLRMGMSAIPIGMNSYWNPMLHPELPWYALRSVCDFDCPQVYWRNSDPVGKLKISKLAFSRMVPKLPFSMVGGDMYYEYGLKPTPQQVTDFMTAADKDVDIQAAVMWSMDGRKWVPELWAAFSQYQWSTSNPFPPPPPPPPPPVPEPLYVAVTLGSVWIHSSPNALVSTRIDSLLRGTRVDVFSNDSGWSKISGDEEEYVSSAWLKQL